MGFRLIKGIYRNRILIGGRGPAMLTKLGRSYSLADDKFTFADFYWQSGIDDTYMGFLFDSSYNNGQITILNDYKSDIYEYLFDVGADYNPDEFISYLEDNLGSEKFAALSETWESFAEELLDLWDHSMGGDGFAKKKFLGVIYE